MLVVTAPPNLPQAEERIATEQNGFLFYQGRVKVTAMKIKAKHCQRILGTDSTDWSKIIR
jgi:hypothetical protein